jgi:hypothetical protein
MTQMRRSDSQIYIDLEAKRLAVTRRMAREADPKIGRLEKIQRLIEGVLEEQKFPLTGTEQEALLNACSNIDDAISRYVEEFMARTRPAE